MMDQSQLQEKYLETLQQNSNIDKRLALMEQDINNIKRNHLSHIESDIKAINTKFNWAVGCVFVQMLGIISYLIIKM